MATTTRKTKKIIKSIADARLYVQSTFNNTIVTVTDDKGNTLPGPLPVSAVLKVLANQLLLRPPPPSKRLWKRPVPMVLKNYQFISKVRALVVMPPLGFFVVKETMMST